MITLLTIVLIENAFLTWLFDVAPLAAMGIVFGWAIWRAASMYGNYEARFTSIDSRFTEIDTRFTRLETDIKELKVSVANLDTRLGRVEGRLDGVEGQLRIVIDLLKNKKIS